MTKKRTSRARQKKQHQKHQQNLILGAVLLLVLGGFVLLALNNRATSYNERYDLDPVLGNPDAPVTIVEYSAYGCPACRAVHQLGVLDQIIEEYDGQVNLVFRDMPIISPEFDFMSAQLAQCVLDQGNDLFWEFHNMMYTVAQIGTSTKDELVANAGQLGIDATALNACYEAGTHANTVRYDQKRGTDLGIRGAPTFFIGEERLFNFQIDTFRDAIDRALQS